MGTNDERAQMAASAIVRAVMEMRISGIRTNEDSVLMILEQLREEEADPVGKRAYTDAIDAVRTGKLRT